MKTFTFILIFITVLFAQVEPHAEPMLNVERYLKYTVGISEDIELVVNGEDARSNSSMITFANLTNSSSVESFRKSKQLHIISGTAMGTSGLVMFLGLPAAALMQEDLAIPYYIGVPLFSLSIVPLVKAIKVKRRGYEQYERDLRRSSGMEY